VPFYVVQGRGHREYGPPIPQHMSLEADKVADLTDLDEDLLWFHYRLMCHLRFKVCVKVLCK